MSVTIFDPSEDSSKENENLSGENKNIQKKESQEADKFEGDSEFFKITMSKGAYDFIMENFEEELEIIRQENLESGTAVEDGAEQQYVKIGLQGGGCSGFRYYVTFVSKDEVNSEIDHTFKIKDLPIVVDEISIMYLNGILVTYERNAIAGGSINFENPNATSTCSCGESFSV